MPSGGRRENGPILPISMPGSRNSQPTSAHSHRQPSGHHAPRSHRASTNNYEETTRSKLRAHFVASSGEFVGTTLFLFFAFSGTQIANTIGTGDTSQLLFISLVFAFSLLVNVWVFFRISGGLFNPAVTLALCLAGAVPWLRGLFLFITQLIAGMVAAGLVYCMFPGPMTVDTTLNNGTTTAQGLFIEAFLTSILVITVLMLAVEKSKDTFLAPVGIGLSLFVAELSGVYFTGGSLNPTRSFGPCVVNRDFPNYHWIYWLGPVLGACAAVGYYKFAKYMNYEEANPGQDATRAEEETHEKLAKAP